MDRIGSVTSEGYEHGLLTSYTQVDTADVDVIVKEFELSRKAADRALRYLPPDRFC